MSRRASQAGIKLIRQAMKRNGWTQVEVAREVRFSRSTLNQILGGQAVRLENLEELCHLFDLQVGQVIEPEDLTDSSNLDPLVQTVRDRIRPLIQDKCGTMRVLDMNQPIELGEIYTHVNILEKITGRSRRELAELMQDVAPETFERFSLSAVKEKRIPGLEAVEKHSKLMILGKPGAGKTTFLKHLAIQCSGGIFQPHRVPLFITLKDFAEAEGRPDLLAFIDQIIHPSVRAVRELPQPTLTITQQILDHGRALILLDGLDEVRETDANRVLRQIQQFSELYSSNAFVITCRIAAGEYTFQQFTEVEVADFDNNQITDFASKWFCNRETDTTDTKTAKTKQFLQKLNEKPRTHELATSPLLLSLLCLIFEDAGKFPVKRVSIYEQGIELLLREWNSRERKRCPFYKELSPNYRRALLQVIAIQTFEKGNYFFKQQEIEGLIKEYIESLGCFTQRELLKLDPKATLETIEVQHGLLIKRTNSVYSFSHLTFHEYLFSVKFVETLNDGALQHLATHIAEKRWREVFLLVSETLRSTDGLILAMKRAINQMLETDQDQHRFWSSLDKKSRSIEVRYHRALTWAFYLNSVGNYGFCYALAGPISLDYRLIFVYERACELSKIEVSKKPFSLPGLVDELLKSYGEQVLKEQLDFSTSHFNHCERSASRYGCMRGFSEIENYIPYNRLLVSLRSVTSSACYLCSEFYQAMQNLEAELPKTRPILPTPYDDVTSIEYKNKKQELSQQINVWWQMYGQKWIEKLRDVMVKYRNIGHDWQFTDDQKQQLQQYYDANKLLVDCLNSGNVSREVRQEIEETLLLPIVEIEKRRRKG